MKCVTDNFFFVDGDYYFLDTLLMRLYKIKCSKDEFEEKCSLNPNRKAHDKYVTSVRKCDCVTVILTNACNLRCSYCYYQYESNRKIININRQSFLESFIKLYNYFPDGIMRVQFFGGEPLIEYESIKLITLEIINFCRNNGKQIPVFGMNTNATLLSREMMDFFNEHKFILTISIDGKEDNNSARVYANGEPTFQKLIEIIESIHSWYPNFVLSAEMTFSLINVQEFKVSKVHDIETLHKLGITAVHMSPVISNDSKIDLFGEKSDLEDLFSYLKAAYDYSISTFFSEHTIITSDYQHIASLLRRHETNNCFCSAGIEKFAIDQCGDIYPCHMFVENDQYKLSDNEELCQYITSNLFRNSKENITLCRNCFYRNFCNRCEFMPLSKKYCEYIKYRTRYIVEQMIKYNRDMKTT